MDKAVWDWMWECRKRDSEIVRYSVLFCAYSSALQAEGQRFEPVNFHQTKSS
mgnify:CR=1 FL=1